MQLVRKDKSVIGDCEGSNCNATNTEVWKMHGNMLLCTDCRAKELEIMARTAPNTPTPVQADHTIKHFGKVGAALTGQADIYNALTVPFVELRAAIFASPDIPETAKQSEYVRQLNDQMVNLKRILMETQISIQICQTTGQSAAMELHESERAKYVEFDGDYKNITRSVKPANIKRAATGSPKTPKASTPKVNAKATATAAFDAAKKYPGMDGSHVQMYMMAHHCDAEKAAELVSKSTLYKRS